jgi:hypothetical protein
VRRARLRRRHVTGLAPAALLLGPWAWLGVPGGGTAGLVLAGLAVLAYPPAVLMSPGFPACLVPRQSRARHRAGKPRPSSAMPSWLHRVALIADLRRCAFRRHHRCEGPPEVDHVCPQASGGLATIINAVVLCHTANMIKSDYWQDRDGYEHYNPWPGYSDKAMAARILACERRARLNPLRYARAVLALR